MSLVGSWYIKDDILSYLRNPAGKSAYFEFSYEGESQLSVFSSRFIGLSLLSPYFTLYDTIGILLEIISIALRHKKKVKGAKTKQKFLETADGGNRGRLMENLIVYVSPSLK